MKKLILSVLTFFLIQLLIGCSGSQEAVSYSYEKLGQIRQDGYTEVWTYRYSIAEGPWEEIDIYVRTENQTYVMNVGTYFGNEQNRYVYKSLKRNQNFASQFRNEPGTVASLNEAVEMALSWYIEDQKIYRGIKKSSE